MGKNKKKVISRSVTILTPTTSDRQNVLCLLSKCIESQTYTNITEWLLIDGSRDGKFVDRSFVAVKSGTIKHISNILYTC